MTNIARHEGDPGAQAVEWIVRLGAGPLDSTEQQALDAWIAAHPFHAAALEDARTVWTKMGDLARSPGSLARYSAPAGMFPAPGRDVPGIWSKRWTAAGALAAALVLAVTIGSAWTGDPLILLRADHRTGIAQRETVTLADGSRVDLGPSSAISVDYDGRQRRVELLRGIAYFVVTPKEQAGERPFVVSADGGSATALGTRFLVDRLPAGVDVTVVEHKVAVSAGGDDSAHRVVLLPGQRVHYGETGGLGAVTPTRIDFALAWRSGRLVFDRVPLGDVIAELNRYRSGRIMVRGEALSRRRVSGVVDVRDIDDAIDALAKEVGARSVHAPLLTLLY